MHAAHRAGLIHRVVYVLIEDGDGNILLQRRSPTVAVYPDCWDVSASGHVDEGESYKQAAERELTEEIGLKGYELTELGGFYDETVIDERRLRRFCRAYKTHITQTTPLKLAADEVSDVQWFDLQAVRSMLNNKDRAVAAGLEACIKRYYKT